MTSQLGELTVTAPLVICSTIVALGISVPLGVYSAMRRNKADGVGLSAIGQLGIAVPQFLVAMILIALLAGTWDLPSQGFPVRDGTSSDERHVRSSCRRSPSPPPRGDPVALRALVDARRAQPGLHAHRPIEGPDQGRGAVRPRLRNASIPVVSVVGVQLASLLAGVVVIENVFNLPGVGQMLLRDIGNRDFDKVQGTVLIAVVVLVIGFLVDVAHYLIDPRLRTGAR